MNWRELIIGVLLIVVLLFLFKKPEIKYQDKIIVKTDTVTVVDTLYIPFKEKIIVKEFIIDSTYVDDNNDSIRVYNHPIGLQYGTVNIITHTTGKIKYQAVSFDLRFPQPVTTRTITVTKVLPYHYDSVYLGVGTKVGINPFKPSVGIGGSLSYKSHLLQYHYDNHGTHWVTYHKQFQLKLPIWKKPFNF